MLFPNFLAESARKSMNLYEGCLCAISATQNGILIKNADDNLQKDLQFIIDKYISESGWSDAVLKLMEVQDEIEFEPEENGEN